MEEYLQELGVNKQGPTLKHSELCSMSCGSLERRGVWGRMDTCICIAEFLCCPPKTITTSAIFQYKIKTFNKRTWGEQKFPKSTNYKGKDG